MSDDMVVDAMRELKKAISDAEEKVWRAIELAEDLAEETFHDIDSIGYDLNDVQGQLDEMQGDIQSMILEERGL